ncbi:MAG: hypothetical protein AAF086_08645 [Planctomycetota bacterium]
MSQMTLDCPNCGRGLLVPEAAVGRKARCTECNTRFVIPSREELLEQTITQMALEELDHRYHEDDPLLDEIQSSSGRHTRPDYPVSSTGTVLGMPAIAHEPSPNEASGVLSVDDLSRPADSPAEPVIASAPASTANGVAPSPHTTATADTAPDKTDAADTPSTYPTDLRPVAPRPYLVVNEVSMRGVSLSFAAEWLRHEVFRTSMPIRCAFTGKGPEIHLVSRPMIFTNRSEDLSAQPRAYEMRYEQTVGAKHSPRDHVRGIGRMDDFAEPFDRPMLYYACDGHAGESIRCRAHTDASGRDHCEVLIPFGEVAVDWLSRVNGRCGREYALLKTAVAHLSTDGWSTLPEKTQRRLETWCKFERGERFKLYLNDADLTVSDLGLGGVVVTDRRLLYQKFRRSRSLSLNQDAVLHLRTDGLYVRITLESGGRLARAGKIHRTDMDKLIQALEDAPRVKVVVGKTES